MKQSIELKTTTVHLNSTPGNDFSQDKRNAYTSILRRFLVEAYPFFTTRAIELLVDYFMMVMAGKINEETLAATSLMMTSQFLLRSINATFLYYTAILSAQAQHDEVIYGRESILHASWAFTALIAVPAVVTAQFSAPILRILGQPATAAYITQNYLRAYALGILPTLLTISCQQYTLGQGHPLIVLAGTLLTRPLAPGIGYLLLHGSLGLPRTTVDGLGYANTISYTLNFLFFLGVLSRSEKFHRTHLGHFYFAEIFKHFKTLVKKGIPIGVYACIELGSLTFATILIGTFGERELAAAQPAIQYGSILANVTYALSTTAGILVAKALSHRQPRQATRFASIDTFVCLALPTATTLVFLLTKPLYLKPFIDTDHFSLVTASEQFLLSNLCNQIADGLRNAATGHLRGYGNTLLPMIAGLSTTLLINAPAALAACFLFDDPNGVLIARGAGITVGAIWLYLHYTLTVKSTEKNVDIKTLLIGYKNALSTRLNHATTFFAERCCPSTSQASTPLLPTTKTQNKHACQII